MLANILKENFILMQDSYKVPHADEMPKDTKHVCVSIVPRKPSKYTKEIVASGQTLTAAYLASVRITQEMIDEAEEEITAMGYEFPRHRWEYILREHGGALPMAMFGVEEGRVVKPQTPIVAFINTDENCWWLPGYTETIAQSVIWKMSTVASKSRFFYKKIEEAMIKTGADMSMLEYKMHNFGDRAVGAPEEAVRAAIAHAMLFSGSDCMSANRAIKKLYQTKKSYLSSVEATEHSVMCSWSDAKNRDDFGAAKMLVDRLDFVVERTKRGIGIPLISGVIDTYDDERFVKEYIGTRLKDRVINSGGRLVMRPDSGNPLTKPIEVDMWIAEKFGQTVNDLGYAVLPGYIGVIQGDGINVESVPALLDNIIFAGRSMDNYVFGCGNGLTHDDAREKKKSS